MPDPVSRKRHIKKVLDRWENEGGSLPARQTNTSNSPSSAPQTERIRPMKIVPHKQDATHADALHPTHNDLPAQTRASVVPVLNARLADTIDLLHQAKQAHWNVKGRNFIALHKLFDEIASAAAEHMDLIAERAVQLGGTAEGTIQIAARRSKLESYPLEISDEQDHVAAMSASLAAYGKRVRQAIDQSDELDDKDTADLFTEVSRAADKYLWFVESHLERTSSGSRKRKVS
jgi:starvation-inducible DNA-binding protein